ncbi:hypothetical protein MNBD_NITROSPINAE01-1226 [hydrothermal vent metagenome]|uniref:Uncharacterized protein n=1 Tax=hydrothermal vent metagenome TaxID=652676 RepID=A0A3B1BH85_9ZZZZ
MKKMKKLLVCVVAVFAIGLVSACTSSGPEDKYQDALNAINKTWSVYEVKQDGKNTIIRVEVTDVVSFKDAKKAMKALQAIEPELTGYVEFYNSEVGMTLRKLEIFPGS